MASDSRIYLTRHGLAEHNVDEDYSIPDAPLTPLGKKQAAAITARIDDSQQQVDLIVTSPLRRALQTTLRTWAPAIERLGKQNMICLPEAQECNDLPCDTGSSREDLESDPEYAGVDFSRLTLDWTSKRGFWAQDLASKAKRAQWVRKFLRDRPEKNIVLVAHGDFLRQLTSDRNGSSTYMWKNVEIQIFKFDETTVHQDDCFIKLDRPVEAAGGYTKTSGDIEVTKEVNGRL